VLVLSETGQRRVFFNRNIRMQKFELWRAVLFKQSRSDGVRSREKPDAHGNTAASATPDLLGVC
jgi:hypothetical protein